MEEKKIEFKALKAYEIDYDKVKDVDDVISLLKLMNIKVYENFVNFEEFKPFLKEVE